MQRQKIKFSLLGLLYLLFPAMTKAVSISNPLSANSLPELINNVIRGILGVIGAISLIMVVVGGVMWMTSSGNADRIRRGKDTLVWAIVGLVVVFLSYAIINFVFESLG